MKKIILILSAILFLFGCSQTPQKYYFVCNEQTPDIVYTYFPQAINLLDYSVIRTSNDSNFIIASKPILRNNKVKGIETHSIQIKFQFVFDNDKLQSHITQYYVVEMNGKQTIKKLNQDQLKKYEKDVITLQEKLLFYCRPRFKGR